MTIRITYRMAKVMAGTNMDISNVKQQTLFDVIVLARDKRAPGTYTADNGVVRKLPRGLFAGYVNVLYEPGTVKILGATFNDRYCNDRIFRDTMPGIVTVGAFASVAAGAPTEVELVRLRCQAGPLYTPEVFTTELSLSFDSLDHPKYDSLLYGINIPDINRFGLTLNEASYVPPEEIEGLKLSVPISYN